MALWDAVRKMQIRTLVFSTLLLYFIALSSYSIVWTESHNLDLTVFVHAGEKLGLEFPGVYTYPGSEGYDGQIYLLIAEHPLDLSKMREVDSEQCIYYRYQRILYPLTVHALSLGSIRLMPYMMLLVNLVSVLLSTVVFHKLLSLSKHPLAYSLYLPMTTGLFLSVLLDLTEPMWVLFILAAFYFLSRGEHVKSAAFILLASFTKETTLLLVVPLVLHYLYIRDSRTAIVFLASLVPFLMWQGVLFSVFGSVPLLYSMTFSTDYQWLYDSLLSNLTSPQIPMLPVYLILATIPAAIVVSLSAFRRNKSAVTTVLLANSMLILLLLVKKIPWEDVFAASRTILPLALVALIYLAESGDRKTHYVLLPSAVLTLLLSVFYLIKAVSILV
ncbi:MAG: hypothetical protein V1744_06730 [Candidatus Altiarchaeota archaeon]